MTGRESRMKMILFRLLYRVILALSALILTRMKFSKGKSLFLDRLLFRIEDEH